MKIKSIISLAIAAAALGLASLATDPAASAMPSAAAHQPVTHGYIASGQISPWSNQHLCLTATYRPRDDDRVFLLPCVRPPARSSLQEWTATRFANTGIISLTVSDLALCQQGRLSVIAKTCDVQDGIIKPHAVVNLLIHFTAYERGWLLDLPRWHTWFLTAKTAHAAGTVPQWRRALSSSAKREQEWVFKGAWRPIAAPAS